MDNIPKQQFGVYGNPKEDFETAKAGLSGFFGLPNETSVMNPASGNAYRNSELASLFSDLIPGKAPLAVGAGILKKFHTIPSYLKESIANGRTARQLFDDYNAVKVGDDYFQFLKDDIRTPPQGSQGTYLVKDLTNGLSKDVGDIPVSFEPMRSTLWGSAEHYGDGRRAIRVNNGLSPTSQRETIGHEIQHPYDKRYNGLSGGTTVAKSNNSALEYQHNLGEVRARLNALLNNDPDHFQGLHSVFKKDEFDPRLLWED